MAHVEDDAGAPDAAPPEPPTIDASLKPSGSGGTTPPAAGSTAPMNASPAGHAANAGTAGSRQPPAAVSDVKGGCSIGGIHSNAALGGGWLAVSFVLLARRRRPRCAQCGWASR
jgi:hypothetical protein